MEIKSIKNDPPQTGDKIIGFWADGSGCKMLHVLYQHVDNKIVYLDGGDGEDFGARIEDIDRYVKLPDDFVLPFMASMEKLTCVGMWGDENKAQQRPVIIQVEVYEEDSFDIIEQKARSAKIYENLKDNLEYGPDDFDKAAFLEESKSAVFRLSYCLAGHPDMVLEWVNFRNE